VAPTKAGAMVAKLIWLRGQATIPIVFGAPNF
jgi:hypothetical protein